MWIVVKRQDAAREQSPDNSDNGNTQNSRDRTRATAEKHGRDYATRKQSLRSQGRKSPCQKSRYARHERIPYPRGAEEPDSAAT